MIVRYQLIQNVEFKKIRVIDHSQQKSKNMLLFIYKGCTRYYIQDTLAYNTQYQTNKYAKL